MSNDLFSDFDPLPTLHLGNAPDDDPVVDSQDNRPWIPGYTGLAWTAILLVAVLLAGLALYSNLRQVHGTVSPAELASLKSEGQTVLALKSEGWLNRMLEDYADGADAWIRQTVAQANHGPVERRFGHTILVCETRGPQAALEALEAISQQAAAAGVEYNDGQRQLESILHQVYSRYAAGDWDYRPDIAERERLESVFGWLAELLFHPDQDPAPEVTSRRLEMTTEARGALDLLVGVIGIVGLGLILGVVLLFLFAWLMSTGQIRGRVGDWSRCGGVYAEAFAICLVLFVATSILAGLPHPLFGAFRWFPLFLPPLAVGWAVVRGVSLSHVLRDTGVYIANPLREIGCGILAYLALFPLALAGLMLTVMLSTLMHNLAAPHEFSPMGIPHPVVHDVVSGDSWWLMVRVLLVAAVAAPLIEEFMFRGLLYRHLRDASRHMTRWMSIICSALVNSVLFAAIHPQGIAFIPALVILAFGFCLVRQWRGSLLAPVTMHAIHNAILITLQFQLL